MNIFINEAGKIGQMLNDTANAIKGKTMDYKNKDLAGVLQQAGEDTVSISNTADKVISNPIFQTVVNAGVSKNRSIVAQARNSILQFPVYVSSSIPTPVAYTLSKLYERVYASFTQSALSQYPLVDYSDADGAAFLKKFHINIQESVHGMNELHSDDIDFLDSCLKESVLNMYIHESGAGVFYATVPSEWEKKESLRLSKTITEGFEHYFSEADMPKVRNIGDIASTGPTPGREGEEKTINADKVTAMKLAQDEIHNNPKLREPVDPGSRPVQQTTDDPASYDQRLQSWESQKQRKDDWEQQYDTTLRRYTQLYDGILKAGGKTKYIKYIEDHKLMPDTEKVSRISEVNRLTAAPDSVTKHNGQYYVSALSKKVNKKDGPNNSQPIDRLETIKAPEMLNDASIKKINGMAPWMMRAEFAVQDKSGRLAPVKVQYAIGIKTVFHKVEPNDIGEELDDIIMGKNPSLQKVRYHSGEIKAADYFLQVSKAKKDAMRANSGKWTTRLKKLAEDNTIISKNHIPNATLILSSTDVNSIKAESGYDISSVGIAKKVARSLFLISIAIVDATAGTMKVMFTDMDSQWDIQSLQSIENEVNSTANSSLLRELQGAIMNK